MEVVEKNKPLSLIGNHEYVGYQIRFNVKMKERDRTFEDAMKYVILTCINWIYERTKLDEHKLVSPDEYNSVTFDSFKQINVNKGYIVDASAYVLSDNCWAARVNEPDKDSADRKAVIGRRFITDIAVCKYDEFSVSFACRITVTEPENAEEIPYAFRPVFIRRLYESTEVVLSQFANDIGLNKKPYEIANRSGLTNLKNTINSSYNYFPCVIFTYAEKKNGTGNFETDEYNGNSKDNNLLSNCFVKAKGIFKKFWAKEYFLPYDADFFAEHAFGYARTFVVKNECFSEFKNLLKINAVPGDIIVVSNCIDKNKIKLFSCADYEQPVAKNKYIRKSITEKGEFCFGEVIEYVHQYSKRKPFELRQKFYEEIQEQLLKDKFESLIREVESENNENSKLKNQLEEIKREYEKIQDDRDRCKHLGEQEYERGKSDAEKDFVAERNQLNVEIEKYKNEINDLKKEIPRREAKTQEIEDAKKIKSIRTKICDYPDDAYKIAEYFDIVFADRIVFTPKAQKSLDELNDGIRSGQISAREFWKALYSIADNTYNKKFNGNSGNMYSELKGETGLEFSRGEGKLTHNDSQTMKNYIITYGDEEVNIEPHIKLSGYYRIHFGYLENQRKIVIGHCGYHLPTGSEHNYH